MENEAWPLPFVNAHTTAVIEDDVVLHPHFKFLQRFKKEYNIYLIPSDEISAYLTFDNFQESPLSGLKA